MKAVASNPIILDASVVLSWLLPDETADLVARERLEQQTAACYAPSLLKLEVANALLVAKRRKRLTKQQYQTAWAIFSRLPITTFSLEDCEEAIAEVAEKHTLSVYDACYVYLAQIEQAELLSLDAKLVAAAQKLR